MIGLSQAYNKTQIGAMLASTTCKFIKPLFYPGNIIIQARMAFIKNTSFGFHHQILNANNEICAEADDVMVYYDFNKNEKLPFPNSLREMVEKLEKRDNF